MKMPRFIHLLACHDFAWIICPRLGSFHFCAVQFHDLACCDLDVMAVTYSVNNSVPAVIGCFIWLPLGGALVRV
jgi:hypothetical protein